MGSAKLSSGAGTKEGGGEPGQGQGSTGPPIFDLSDQLTRFQPGRADYPHLLLLHWHPQSVSLSGITA